VSLGGHCCQGHPRCIAEVTGAEQSGTRVGGRFLMRLPHDQTEAFEESC
jgi:riboflavin synthase alpha subunit